MSAGVNLMYQNILGRTPSEEELQGWQSTGLTGQALYDAFNTAAQQERQARRAASPAPMGNASTMIDANYATLVGRDPTEAERTSWMGSGLTGDALYNAMAQAAQGEQQARNFTATNPWAQEGDAETIATVQQNLQNALIGGLGGLGGTDTGGTDTGGTGDAGGTDTGGTGDAVGDNPGNAQNPFDMNAFFDGLSGLASSWQQPFQQVLGGWQDAQAQQNQQLTEFRNALQNQQSGFLDTWRQFQTEQQQAQQAAQQNQMQGFQDLLGMTLGSFQNNLGTNSPTFGPGSGGNFGGQISPVYRPTQNGTDAQPRNGWGGPWQSNNPFAPTF